MAQKLGLRFLIINSAFYSLETGRVESGKGALDLCRFLRRLVEPESTHPDMLVFTGQARMNSGIIYGMIW